MTEKSKQNFKNYRKNLITFSTLLILFLLSAHSNTSLAQSKNTVIIPHPLGNVEYYKNLTDAEKRASVGGMINGIFVSTAFGADQIKVQKLNECISGMSDEQIRLIFDTHINNHPELIDRPIHILFVQAMSSACTKRGKPFNVFQNPRQP